METKPIKQESSLQNRPIWQQALMKAEGKFLAISGKEEDTRIELGFASMIIEGNDKLKACEQGSIVNAVINVARTGITLNPVLKLAYLIPRGSKCVLDFSYIGLIKILKDNNCIKDIQAIIVYGDEKFEESGNPIIKPTHEKKYAKTEEEQKKREKAGVYCSVLLPDNTVVYTPFTPAWEILKAKKVSPAASSSYSPWTTWEESMWKKTKIKQDFKTLISGSPDSKALAALEVEQENTEVEFNGNQNNQQARTTSVPKSTLDNIFGAEEAVIVEEQAAISPNTSFETEAATPISGFTSEATKPKAPKRMGNPEVGIPKGELPL